MPKQQQKQAEGTDPEVRITAVIPKSVRFRLRIVSFRVGETLERMAARWLTERLEAEEKRLKGK